MSCFWENLPIILLILFGFGGPLALMGLLVIVSARES